MSTITIATDRVSTNQEMPLGFIYREPAVSVGTDAGYGERTWVYVFNDEASTAFAAGQIIVRDPSATTEDWYGGLICAAGTVTPKVLVLGVAQHAIAAGSYGFILCRGVGTILSGTADLTADTAFTSGGATNAGSALDFADGVEEAVIGHTAAAIDESAADTGTAWIDCL